MPNIFDGLGLEVLSLISSSGPHPQPAKVVRDPRQLIKETIADMD